jgi:hypothetical protein
LCHQPGKANGLGSWTRTSADEARLPEIVLVPVHALVGCYGVQVGSDGLGGEVATMEPPVRKAGPSPGAERDDRAVSTLSSCTPRRLVALWVASGDDPSVGSSFCLGCIAPRRVANPVAASGKSRRSA